MTKRPTQYDESVRQTAARALTPEVVRWCNSGGDSVDEQEVEADLIRAMKWETDGYAIARALERDRYYSPDSELVDILDSAWTHLHPALESVEKEWLKTSGLTAPEIGSHRRSKSRPNSGIGEVTRNYDTGKSTVFFAGLGHVKEGLGTHGLVLPWEDLEPVEEMATA